MSDDAFTVALSEVLKQVLPCTKDSFGEEFFTTLLNGDRVEIWQDNRCFDQRFAGKTRGMSVLRMHVADLLATPDELAAKIKQAIAWVPWTAILMYDRGSPAKVVDLLEPANSPR
jgi:hypothetical protein